MMEERDVWPNGMRARSIIAEFPTSFSSTFGTARVASCEIELSDNTPVLSPPYRCAPPKLEIFRRIVDEMLEQGVVRPSKNRYASPKGGDAFRMVVDYGKFNSKIVFDSYPMPTIDQAFEQLGGAVVF